MGTTYTAKIEISCWKQHTCVGCGALFRYRFSRTVTGSAGTPDRAHADAIASAEREMKDGVEARPCPTCGLYQPEMIGARRARVHGWTATIVVLGTILVGILAKCDAASFATLSTWSVLIGLFLAAANVAAAAANPNANLEANFQKAVTYVGERELYCDRPGSAARPRRIPGSESFTTSAIIALVLIAVGALLIGAGEGARLINHWTVNPDCTPPIAGPGDTVRLMLPESIDSINGMWKGSVKVVCTNAKDLSVDAPFVGETQASTWGESIYTKGGMRKTPIWVDVTIPDSPELRNERVDLAIDVDLVSPCVVSGTQFLDYKGGAHHETSVTLSSPGAAATYTAVWWVGVIIGGLMTAIGALMLWFMARSLIEATNAKCLPMAAGGAIGV